ncbi:MAG TPA: cytochrome c [Saprospiraceae bacterium]|nr:cytochrome c [Saprospiraceae bacterium]
MTLSKSGLLIWIVAILCSLIVTLGCNTYTQGQRIYSIRCAGCHGEHGEGLERLYPPLKLSNILTDSIERLPCIITKGLIGSRVVNGITFDHAMAPVTGLSSIEMTNLFNYLLHDMFDSEKTVTPADIEGWLKSCE